jgi:hypothetical protein
VTQVIAPHAGLCTKKGEMVREKPPPSPKVVEKKKRARSKSVKRAPTLSPFQERLKETEFYTKPKFDDFQSTPAVKVLYHCPSSTIAVLIYYNRNY